MEPRIRPTDPVMPTQFTLDGPDGRKMTFRAWSSVDSVISEGGHSRKNKRRQNTSDLASHNRHRMSGVKLEPFLVQAASLKSEPDFSIANMTDSIFLDAVMRAFLVPISEHFLL